MTYTAEQRRRAAARQRALQQQEEKARAAVPEGHKPVGAQLVTVPLPEQGRALRLNYADLERILGVPGLAGFVATSAGWTQVLIVGGPLGLSAGHLRAWASVPYRVGPESRIELSSSRARTIKLLPFERVQGWSPRPLPEPALDSNGLPCVTLPPLHFPFRTTGE
jgi:hypothetical protein